MRTIYTLCSVFWIVIKGNWRLQHKIYNVQITIFILEVQANCGFVQ